MPYFFNIAAPACAGVVYWMWEALHGACAAANAENVYRTERKRKMRMQVINDYAYEGQVIELQAGDAVRLGRRTDADGPNPNWIFCRSERTGREGWVAACLLTPGTEDNRACANENYTSEELPVFAGDIVEPLYECSGWHWCRRISDAKEGWVEAANLGACTA